MCSVETLRKVTCGHACQKILEDYRRAVARKVRGWLHQMRKEGTATHA